MFGRKALLISCGSQELNSGIKAFEASAILLPTPYLKTGSHCVAQAGFKFIEIAYLCLQSAEIKDMYHNAQSLGNVLFI